MDVKDAVRAAKSWLEQTLSEEAPFNIGLDEVEYDDAAKVWRITLGFSRPWDKKENAFTVIAGGSSSPVRSYRIISVDDNSGAVLSMKRQLSDVAS
jgi:hypothetical protein